MKLRSLFNNCCKMLRRGRGRPRKQVACSVTSSWKVHVLTICYFIIIFYHFHLDESRYIRNSTSTLNQQLKSKTVGQNKAFVHMNSSGLQVLIDCSATKLMGAEGRHYSWSFPPDCYYFEPTRKVGQLLSTMHSAFAAVSCIEKTVGTPFVGSTSILVIPVIHNASKGEDTNR